MVNGLHLQYIALYNIASHSHNHSLIHTPTTVSTMQDNSQLVRSSWGGGVRCLAPGHLDTC